MNGTKLIGVLLLPFLASAATAAPDVKTSIVRVVARGIDTEAGNVERVASGTGFFTSEVGFLATSAHLRKNLGKVDEASVAYEIYFDRFSSSGIPASFQYISDPSDLLILYAPVGGENIRPMIPSRRPLNKIRLGETPIFTAGYPQGYGYTVNTGVITAFSGPVRNVPLWATNLTFKEGQSGSPVYLASGEVIGMAKGVDRDAAIGLLVPAQTIPSNYWDSYTDSNMLTTAGSPLSERLVASARQLAVAPRERSERAEFINPQCTATRRHVKRIRPKDGWILEPDSVKLKPIAVDAQNVQARIDSVSPSGFDLIVDIENVGKCLEVNGSFVARDIPGKYVTEVSFREAPKPSAEEEFTIAKSALVPGAKIPLGNLDPKNLVLTITGPNGTRSYLPKRGDIVTEGGQSVLRVDSVISPQP